LGSRTSSWAASEGIRVGMTGERERSLLRYRIVVSMVGCAPGLSDGGRG
jgi:hypothetical protein